MKTLENFLKDLFLTKQFTKYYTRSVKYAQQNATFIIENWKLFSLKIIFGDLFDQSFIGLRNVLKIVKKRKIRNIS